MKIEYCPKCGVEDPARVVDGDTSCSECDWYYGSKEYRRIGTHPGEFDRYCEECVTVYPTVSDAEDHLCTVTGLLEEYGDSWPVEALEEELAEFHGERSAQRKILYSVRNRDIVFSPGLETVDIWPDDGIPDLCEQIERYVRGWEQVETEPMEMSVLEDMMQCSSEIESECVHDCVTVLDKEGVLLWDRRGLSIR